MGRETKCRLRGEVDHSTFNWCWRRGQRLFGTAVLFAGSYQLNTLLSRPEPRVEIPDPVRAGFIVPLGD
jgi:hypothetical protein